MYTCIPSLLRLPSTPSLQPSRSPQSTKLSSPHYTAASRQLFILHKVGYICFPGGSVVKNHLKCRICRFNPWVKKILGRRKWHPTQVFLPGKSHGQRSLVGYSPGGSQRVRPHLSTKQQQECVYNNGPLEIRPTRSFPDCVPKSGLYFCDSLPALQIGSSVAFF